MVPRIRVAIDLPRDLRRKLRLAAMRREVTQSEYVREALQRQVSEDLGHALSGADDPVLAELWNNPEDDVYDRS